MDRWSTLPEEIKRKLIKVVIDFQYRTGASSNDCIIFINEIMKLYKEFVESQESIKD